PRSRASRLARSWMHFAEVLLKPATSKGRTSRSNIVCRTVGFDRLADMAADLVRRQVNVLAAPGGSVTALAAMAATKTIPIVFGVAEDPVKLGLVASLARPGGNATGINYLTAEVAAKRLGLLRDLVPGSARIAVLVNPANTANTASTLADIEPAARGLGL